MPMYKAHPNFLFKKVVILANAGIQRI